MEVILKEDFPQLGFIGDSVRVKPGFARNFLIPRGLAVVANTRQANVINHEMQAINAKKARLKELANEKKGKIESLSLEFKLKAGEEGKVFGSITSQHLEDSIKGEGIEIEKKQIKLFEPLKSEGEYSVDVKLHSEVIASLKVLVSVDKYQRPTKKKVDKRSLRKSPSASLEDEAQELDEAEIKVSDDKE